MGATKCSFNLVSKTFVVMPIYMCFFVFATTFFQGNVYSSATNAQSFFERILNGEAILKDSFYKNRQQYYNDQFPKNKMQNFVEISPKSYKEWEHDANEEVSEIPEVDKRNNIPVLRPPTNTHINDLALDLNDTHHLYWQVDYITETVRLEVHSRALASHPWIAIGFSDRGEIIGSDLCVFWVDWKHHTHFQNAKVNHDNRFEIYPNEECHNFRYRLSQGVLKFTFTRLFEPCGEDHYKIERGTTHIYWTWGEGPLFTLEKAIAKGQQGDFIKVELLKPHLPAPAMQGTQVLDIHSKAVHLPVQETTYWCTVHKVSEKFSKKHHIFKFGPKIQKGNEDIVHHMEVFHCEYPPSFEVPMYQGLCHDDRRPREIDACKRVIAAWAMGAPPFAYPDEAGLQLGGDDFNPFVMLEVHYNNPGLTKNRVDSSGISLTYSPVLRKHDAAIMELGLEYTPKMAIPPKMESFTLQGFCIPECTALGVPPEGIFIFGSQLHTHLTGVRVWTKHLRGDSELEEMNRDNHYSTHFQEIRRLPKLVHILPGDALITSCEYRTLDRDNVTLGGFSIRDEMCINYVHYYPKVELEVCKSSIDSQTLEEYFQFINRLEYQPTSKEFNVVQNYHAIQWNPLRSLFLQNMYNEAPLSMQCNKSSGERFPGFWEDKAIPTILHPLKNPLNNTKCFTSDHHMRLKENGEIIIV